MRLLPIALALLLCIPLAAAAPSCGAQPGRKGTVYGCDVDGDGRADAWAATTCGPANPTACAVAWNYTQGGVTHEDSWDGQARQANSTTHGQASEAPIPGGLDRSANGTFHCAVDGCAIVGDTGQGPAGAAYNVTPHWTVDAAGPNLAYNGTAAGDLDGDGAPDVALSGSCWPAPCSNPALAVTFGRDKLKGTTRVANGTAAADLDGDGLAVARAFDDGKATTFFVAAAGSAHGCTVRHEASQQAISNCK
jgi:hypothetical protein